MHLQRRRMVDLAGRAQTLNRHWNNGSAICTLLQKRHPRLKTSIQQRRMDDIAACLHAGRKCDGRDDPVRHPAQLAYAAEYRPILQSESLHARIVNIRCYLVSHSAALVGKVDFRRRRKSCHPSTRVLWPNLRPAFAFARNNECEAAIRAWLDHNLQDASVGARKNE